MTTLTQIVDKINESLTSLTEEDPRLLVPHVFGRINNFSLDTLVSNRTISRTIRNQFLNANLKKTFAQNTSEFTNMFSFSITELNNHQIVDNGIAFTFDFRGTYGSPMGFTVWNRITSLFSDSVAQSSQEARYESLTIRGVLTFSVTHLTPHTNPITGQTSFVEPRSPDLHVYNIRWSGLSIDFPPTTRIVHSVDGTVRSTTLDKDLSYIVAEFSPDLYQVMADELNLRFAGVILSVC